MSAEILLGLDPGTARFGWGVVASERGDFTSVAFGCIETKSDLEMPVRLELLFNGINDLLSTYKPVAVGIENLYFMKNVKTGISVAQARGTAMLACQLRKIPSIAFDPTQIKFAVTGTGGADKKQVQKMVQIQFQLKEIPKPDDAADGLAVALCLALQRRNVRV